jgi:hypothetical protein
MGVHKSTTIKKGAGHMPTDWLGLLARFAYSACAAGSCATREKAEILRRFLQDTHDVNLREQARGIIIALPNLNPFRLILEEWGTPLEAAIAYILGSDLLEKATPEDLEKLWEYMLRYGHKPENVAIANEVAPKEFLPTHLFQVIMGAFIGFRGLNPTIVQGINRCRVSWGVVEDETDTGVLVRTDQLVLHEEVLDVGATVSIVVKNPFGITTTRGTFVAIHQGCIFLELTQAERKTLLHWTRKVLQLWQR